MSTGPVPVLIAFSRSRIECVSPAPRHVACAAGPTGMRRFAAECSLAAPICGPPAVALEASAQYVAVLQDALHTSAAHTVPFALVIRAEAAPPGMERHLSARKIRVKEPRGASILESVSIILPPPE